MTVVWGSVSTLLLMRGRLPQNITAKLSMCNSYSIYIFLPYQSHVTVTHLMTTVIFTFIFQQSKYMHCMYCFLICFTLHCVMPDPLSQDDIIDDVEDFVATAEILKERGAYKIYIMATHGLLSADAPRLLEDSAIDEVKS